MSTIRELDNGLTQVGGLTVSTPYETQDSSVKVEDFLQLMIAQLTNQDFMNPVDDTQYVTQLAQFASMQSMQNLTQYSQTNYAMSLVGKTVTVASYGLGGKVNKDTGVVSAVDLSGEEFTVTVNGKQYTLAQIMQANDSTMGVDQNALDAANDLAVLNTQATNSDASFRWDSPVSDETSSGTLRYDVYYTTNGLLDFNDLETVKRGTNVATGLTDTEYTISGLSPGTTYFVNVVVRNANGDESVYQRSAVTTTGVKQ